MDENNPQAPLNVAGAVPQIVPDDNTDDLKILLGEFEGPLDLLLHLIRQEHVSIYDIPVARITDEYLRYLRVMQELDIAVAGDIQLLHDSQVTQILVGDARYGNVVDADVLLANQVQQEIEWAFKLTEQDFQIVGVVVGNNLRHRAGDVQRSL